ncbi:unnamed protein product [Malus baccata var. baccata]
MEENESRWLCDGGSRVAAGTHHSQSQLGQPAGPIIRFGDVGKLSFNFGYSYFTSDILIHNLIISRIPTHPTKHPHLRYTYFMYVLMLHHPTFCVIQHRQPYCRLIKNQ